MIWFWIIIILIGMFTLFINKTEKDKKKEEKQSHIDKVIQENTITKTEQFVLPRGNILVNDSVNDNILLIDDKTTRRISYEEIYGVSLFEGDEVVKAYSISLNEKEKKVDYTRKKSNAESIGWMSLKLELKTNDKYFYDDINIPLADFGRHIAKTSTQYISSFNEVDSIYKLFESIVINNNKARQIKRY